MPAPHACILIQDAQYLEQSHAYKQQSVHILAMSELFLDVASAHYPGTAAQADSSARLHPMRRRVHLVHILHGHVEFVANAMRCIQ